MTFILYLYYFQFYDNFSSVTCNRAQTHTQLLVIGLANMHLYADHPYFDGVK